MVAHFGLLGIVHWVFSIAFWLLVPILGVVGLVRLSALQGRVADLERRLSALSQQPPAVPVAEPARPQAAAPIIPKVEPPPPPSGAILAPPPPPSVPPGTEPEALPTAPPPPPPPSTLAEVAGTLEENIGGRLSVWVGALALLLGGGFLVKYSIDHDLLRPGVRVALALVGGLVLIGAAEWVRPRASRPAAGLAAGGIGLLYAGLFAAATLYDLIGPAQGFLLMAMVTAGAVSLSLRHGQVVAFVGLIGGYAVPLLIDSPDPNATALFTYLVLLQLGLAAVARHRGWPYLLGGSVIGAMGWGAAWLAAGYKAEQGTAFSIYLLASFAVQAAATGLPGWQAARVRSIKFWPVTIAVAVITALLQAGLLERQGYDNADWLWLSLLCAGSLLLDRYDSRFRWLGWFGALLPLLLLNGWAERHGGETPEAFAAIALVVGGGFALATFLAGWQQHGIGRWMTLSTAVALIDLSIAWHTLAAAPLFGWGYWCLILAAIYLAGLGAVLRAEAAPGLSDPGLVALAVGVTSFISLAIPFELAHRWIGPGWAVEILAVSWIEGRFRPLRLPEHAGVTLPLLTLPVLRLLAGILAAAVLLQTGRVAALQLGDFESETALWLWLGFGVGGSVALLALASLEFLRRSDDAIVIWLEQAAIWLLAAAIAFAVPVLFAGLRVWQEALTLVSVATLAIALLAYALGLDWLQRRWPRRSIGRAVAFLGIIGVAVTLMGTVLIFNPLWAAADVGETPVFNGLLWVYGVPALLVGGLGWRWWTVRPQLAVAAVCSALGLLALLMLLEIRHWFHPTSMDRGMAGDAEHYSYSVAAILFGAGLMAGGIIGRQARLRQAALAVIAVAVCKVFLFDAAALQGLYRVASFFGLGLALIGLGYVYQRLVGNPASGKT